jgi:hypothetical protein
LEDEMIEIEIEISQENEGTSMPWWVIIDPRQNFETGNQGLHNIADMITGPFFSRHSAEKFLRQTRYNFGKTAAVYCLSGCYSYEYSNAIKDAEKKMRSQNG